MTVFLQAATWIQDPLMVDDFKRFCIAWPYAIKRDLTGEKTMDKKGADQLFPEELEVYYASGKGRQVGRIFHYPLSWCCMPLGRPAG